MNEVLSLSKCLHIPVHQNWHHMNWNTIDSFCNYSFLRFLLFFAQIFYFTQEVKFPGFESQASDIIVAVSVWKAIAFQWGWVRSPINKHSLIIFAVIILTDKQYWYYEEVIQNTTWELILKSYTDCVRRLLKKKRKSKHLPVELWSTWHVLIYKESKQNNKSWVLATQRQRILGYWFYHTRVLSIFAQINYEPFICEKDILKPDDPWSADVLLDNRQYTVVFYIPRINLKTGSYILRNPCLWEWDLIVGRRKKLEWLALIIKCLCIRITHPCIVEVLFTCTVLGMFTVLCSWRVAAKKLFSRKQYGTELGAFMLSSLLIWMLWFCFGA